MEIVGRVLHGVAIGVTICFFAACYVEWRKINRDK